MISNEKARKTMKRSKNECKQIKKQWKAMESNEKQWKSNAK